MVKALSVKEAAARLGISERRMRQLLEAGRIPGASKVSGVWIVPDPPRYTPNPPGRPRKSGKKRKGD